MTLVERHRVVAAPAPTRSAMLGPALVALAAALVRLPFLGVPLSSDEGGYLLVASQWRPGPSTYGAYFVDRPPLLIVLYGFADALGGTVPLRLLGLVAVVAAVLVAGALGGTPAALVAGVFLSTPRFDGLEIDGELLAVPFVLAAVLLLVHSLRAHDPPLGAKQAAAAGALAAGAVLVKQNMLDGLVAGVVLLLALALRQGWRAAAPRALGFVGGAATALAAALVVAAAHGTGPAALWDALVTFRAEAAAVIDSSATVANSDRLHGMLIALALSGAPVVALAALGGLRRPADPDRHPDLRWAAVAVLAWEAVGAVLGGSFWLHYLIALVPGLVLLTAAAGPVRWRPVALAMAAVSTGVALVGFAQHPPTGGASALVATYLREHSRPGDTVVVAYGRPVIVREAGLSSPYEHLWSLTARVRDPHLSGLTGILRGPQAPRWVVTSGGSLQSWGIDATTAQRVLDARYRPVTTEGTMVVLERTRVGS